MDIERTTHDYIKLGNGVTISVNSEAPDLTPAHSKVVDAIIKAVGKIEGFDKPPYDTISGADETICGGNAGVGSKPEQPACNPPAPLSERVPAKPKLMIGIAKTRGQGTKRSLKVISIIFENLYEVFDRDEERAMAFVECIASTEFERAKAASNQACEAVHSVGCHSGCY